MKVSDHSLQAATGRVLQVAMLSSGAGPSPSGGVQPASALRHCSLWRPVLRSQESPGFIWRDHPWEHIFSVLDMTQSTEAILKTGDSLVTLWERVGRLFPTTEHVEPHILSPGC